VFYTRITQIKQLISGTKQQKDELVHVLRALVYAKSPVVYEALKLYLAKQLSGMMNPDEDHHADVVYDEDDVFSDQECASDDDISFFDDDDVSSVSGTAVRNARDDEDVRRGKTHRFLGTTPKTGKVSKTSG
jgi:hypothetical protein